MINLEASKTLLTFVLQRYLKLCRAMQCVAELPLLYRYLHLKQSVSTQETKSTVPGNYFYDRLIADLYSGKETSRQRRTVNITGIPVSSSVKVLLIRLKNILNSAV